MVAFGTLHLGLLDPQRSIQLDADAGRLCHRAAGSSCRVRLVAVIFNPSFPYRLVHMVLAAYLTTAFVVGAVGAYHLLRDNAPNAVRGVMFSMAMWMAAIGRAHPDLRGRYARPQHAAASAGQGHGDGRPLREPSRGRAALSVRFSRTMPNSASITPSRFPNSSSLILKHDLNAPLEGARYDPEASWPPVGYGLLVVSASWSASALLMLWHRAVSVW
jgi:cytochrome d ubiquinol oxidase subunit I